MKRILYLEDDEIEVFRIKRAAKGLPDFEITVADSFEKAKTLIGKVEYDLIVTDHGLADGNASDHADWFRNTPVVLVSGMEAHELAKVAKDIGAMECFTKPVSASQLLGFLQTYLLGKSSAVTDRSTITSTKCFDPSILDNATGGDPSLQMELTKMFHESLSKELEKLPEYLADGEREKLQRMVHNLKPKLMIFGQEELSNGCRSIESQLMEGVEFDTIKEQLNKLESDSKEFLGLLKKYLTYN